MKKRIVGLFVLIFLLGACSPSTATVQIQPTASSPTSEPGIQVAATNEPISAPTETAAPLETAAPQLSEAEVVIAMLSDVSSLDPNKDTVVTTRAVLVNVFDSLVHRDSDMSIIPSLAESWENPDDNTWRFHLRQGVQFHNGSTFNAEDVKYTIERIKNPEFESAQTFFVDPISEVIIEDDYTIVLKTEEPWPLLLARFTTVPIVDKETVEEMGWDEFATNPIGTGPYQFVEWQADQHVILERYDDHWRGPAKIKRLVFRVIPEASVRVAELLTGEVDIAADPPVDSTSQLESAGIKVEGVPSQRVVMVMFDPNKGPFGDPLVRQALNYAVDKESIINNLLLGHAYIDNAQIMGPAFFGYNPDLEPYPYDPEMARQLLADAGYPDGFEVEFSTTPNYKEIAEVIAEQLSQVGVTTNILVEESSIQIPKVREKTISPMFMWSWGSSSFDYDGQVTPQLMTGELYSLYSIPELDPYFEIGHTSVNQAERLEAFQQASEIVREEAPVIFLWQQEDLYGVQSDINFKPRTDELFWMHDVSVNP